MKTILNQTKFFLLGFLFLIPALASAITWDPSAYNPLGSVTFEGLIGKIADFLLNAGAAAATIMILYGGFLYMTSAGDETKVKTAHQTLTYAIVGLVVVLIGKGFIYVIQDILGVKSQ